MLMLPVRGLVELLAATTYFANAVPVPLPPDPIVIQVLLLTAVQLHEEGAVTVTAADPPLTPNPLLVGLMEDTQEVGGAC